MNKTSIRIALIGNPNSGKSTLFNSLTGSRQKVGNWPGVTVAKKTGHLIYQNQLIEVVDLPGTYNLSSHATNQALDEQIAINYIINQEADVIVNVIDSTNLERNLFLTTQLQELGAPVILALNMTDLAKRKGLSIDHEALAQQLNCPVIPVIACKQKGVEQLKAHILQVAAHPTEPEPGFIYPASVEQGITQLQTEFEKTHPPQQARYLAIHLLDEDNYAKQVASEYLNQQAEEIKQTIEEKTGDEADILIADSRYQFINKLTNQVISHTKTTRHSVTELVDTIVLNRFLGIPIFLLIMYCMFLFAINIGGAFQDFFDIGSNTIFVQGLAHLLVSWQVPNWLVAILTAGVGKGINTTITFIPIIGGMFLFLSLLESSGYMTRAAFVVDRLMQAVGLPGKSFVPMIVGFGCNVPSIMATRTLENKRDRILTIMMSPFMSCGARLAIFAVFTAAFFPKGGQNIVFALYLTGIFVAIVTGLVLRKTLLHGQPAPLVMEMPPYHMPNLKNAFKQTWQRLKKFLSRAGRFIIPICILIGALNAVTVTGKLEMQNSNQNSILSASAQEITPILAPMGIKQDNWPATVGLITGALAKEVVVGTLNTLYTQTGQLNTNSTQAFHFWQGLKAAVLSIPNNLVSLGSSLGNPILASAPLQDVNQGVLGIMYQAFGGQAAAFAYLLFVLLYVPCVSTTAVMLRELNRGWSAFSVGWSFGLAYGVAVGFYQTATFAEHPLSSGLWLGGLLSAFLITIMIMRRFAFKEDDQVTTPKPLSIRTINTTQEHSS